MKFDLSLIFNAKTFSALAEAYGWTLFITFFALIIGIIVGTLLAVFRVLPQTNIFTKALNKFAGVYISIFRGTPLMVQLFIFSFVIFARVVLVNQAISAYLIAVIGFGLNSGAYVAEIIRGGILSVDKGQMEAGRALGLNYSQTMRKIILPQAGKNIIPPLGNEAISLVKETSVALIIGVSEFFTEIKAIANSTYNVLTPYLFAAFVYYITVAVMAFGLTKIEKRLRKSDAR